MCKICKFNPHDNKDNFVDVSANILVGQKEQKIEIFKLQKIL